MKNLIDKLLAGTLVLLIAFLGILVHDALALRKRHAPKPPYPLTAEKATGIVRLLNGRHTTCTGSVVNDTTVITAGHCVAEETMMGIIVNPNPIEVRANDNIPRGTYGRVHSVSTQLDTAVIHGNFKPYAKFDVIDDIGTIQGMRNSNTRLLACGYPLGGDLYCTIVTYKDLINFQYLVKGQLLPGMSGGPVIAPDGSIIGINDAVTGNTSVISPTFNIKRGF